MATTSRTLLERVRDPLDREAWERFFRLYAPLLQGYAAARGLDPGDAEEVRDQCLEIVARKIRSFRYDRRVGRFQRWLYRIAEGRVVDHLRRRRIPNASTGELGALPDPQPAPDEAWERLWREEHLRFALAEARRLESETTFAVFDLLVLQQRSVPDVAAATGCNANRIYKAKARVLQRVRRILERLGVDEGPLFP